MAAEKSKNLDNEDSHPSREQMGEETPQRQSASPQLPTGAELWPDLDPGSSSTRDLRSDFSFWLKSRGGATPSSGETLDFANVADNLPDLTMPTTVEEVYEDLGEIGHGGMGAVHRVFDRRLLREAALKILRQDVGDRRGEALRFIEEAQITGQLDHPNIVPIHELGQDSRGVHYFTMKLVQGDTLEQVVEKAGTGRLEADSLAELLGIFSKICDAVAFAHSKGVIHRDLKPSNIMVGEFGQVYVMDWGIARLLPRDQDDDNQDDEEAGSEVQNAPTATPAPRRYVRVERLDASQLDTPGTIVGTPRYMAPEQVQGDHERTDHRADVFALGGTLYHILTGHAPYTEQNYFSLLVQVQNCEIRSPRDITGCHDVPKELQRITMKAMAAEPEDRYQSVLDLKREVERFLRGVWHLPTEVFAPGTAIVTEGEAGDTAYIIKRGICRVLKNRDGRQIEVRRMGPGEVFGETAIFSSSVRSATVEAVDEVELNVVTSGVLTRGLGLNSWMGEFVKVLATRFREHDDRLHRSQDSEPDQKADQDD